MKISATLFRAAVALVLIAAADVLPAGQAPKVIHAFVALCDNRHQGIVPVPAALGNGEDPANNLYWGALYGVKTYFKKSPHWKLLTAVNHSKLVLERCVFKHREKNIYLVADAYRGKQIKRTVVDFLNAASGQSTGAVSVTNGGRKIKLKTHGASALLVYVGHNGLMDFNLPELPKKKDESVRQAIILACRSRQYFSKAIVQSGAKPLLWTTGLMAPEAYTLEGALEGWVSEEGGARICLRAAQAYNKYQKCGLKAAKRLLVTGH